MNNIYKAVIIDIANSIHCTEHCAGRVHNLHSLDSLNSTKHCISHKFVRVEGKDSFILTLKSSNKSQFYPNIIRKDFNRLIKITPFTLLQKCDHS